MDTAERVIELLNKYGMAKFGKEWWTGNAKPHIGKAKGALLESLLKGGDKSKAQQTITLLNEYGAAKFGDEWWPGKASSWLDEEEGAELEERLESPEFVFSGSQAIHQP